MKPSCQAQSEIWAIPVFLSDLIIPAKISYQKLSENFPKQDSFTLFYCTWHEPEQNSSVVSLTW